MDSPGVAAARRWSRRKRAGIAALIVAGAIGTGAIADSLFHLRPIAAEKFWVHGLHFTPLRDEAIFRLRNYPTRHAAIALVSYIQSSAKAGDLKSAASATETLCLITGRGFGTAFNEHPRGHFWKSPEDNQWPDVLAQIEGWAERSFGAAR